MITVDLNYIQNIFKNRLIDSNKSNHGHALLLAGSKSKMGAALISSKACLRAGAGLVTIHIPKKERIAVFTSIPEAMIEFREDKNNWEKYTAFAIGPGLGTDKQAEHKVNLVLDKLTIPGVFDADAVSILAKNQLLLQKLTTTTILTPHQVEFDRLFGQHQSELERRNKAFDKAKELGVIIVLKGHQTFITDGALRFQNSTGNSGLAKGGSGDALTGIITAFLAQGYTTLHASLLGVYVHGLAADITLESQSHESMLISDVIDNLGKAFYQIQK